MSNMQSLQLAEKKGSNHSNESKTMFLCHGGEMEEDTSFSYPEKQEIMTAVSIEESMEGYQSDEENMVFCSLPCDIRMSKWVFCHEIVVGGIHHSYQPAYNEGIVLYEHDALRLDNAKNKTRDSALISGNWESDEPITFTPFYGYDGIPTESDNLMVPNWSLPSTCTLSKMYWRSGFSSTKGLYDICMYSIDSCEKLINWRDLDDIFIHVPAGAVPPNTQSTITIEPVPVRDCIIPDDMYLVSDVFEVNSQCDFIKPITIKLRHCVVLEKSTGTTITFIKTQSLLSKFKRCKGGFFAMQLQPTESSEYGMLQTRSFSSFAICIEKIKFKYFSYTLRCNVSILRIHILSDPAKGSHYVSVVVTKDCKSIIEAALVGFMKCDLLHPSTTFKLQGVNAVEITEQIKNNQCYLVYQIDQDCNEILADEIIEYDGSENHPTSPKLNFLFEKKCECGSPCADYLKCFFKFNRILIDSQTATIGSKEFLVTVQCPSDSSHPSSISHASVQFSSVSNRLLDLDRDCNRTVIALTSIHFKWFELGSYLNIPNGTLASIADRHNNNHFRQMSEMISVWMRRPSTQYYPSRRVLCIALAKMGETTLAERIADSDHEVIINQLIFDEARAIGRHNSPFCLSAKILFLIFTAATAVLAVVIGLFIK